MNTADILQDLGHTVLEAGSGSDALVPAPLRLSIPNLGDIDMSDMALRSVSPVHIQYLRNGRGVSFGLDRQGRGALGACCVPSSVAPPGSL